MKKITQFKRKNGIKTPKDPTPRNTYRKIAKKVTSPKKRSFLARAKERVKSQIEKDNLRHAQKANKKSKT